MQLNLYENHSLYLKTRLVAWVVVLFGTIFISIATGLQPNFYTDGFGQFAEGLQLAPLVWSLLWISTSIGLSIAGKLYHPGIDVAFDLIAILLAFGTVWLIIEWMVTIGDYYQNCWDNDCTRTKAQVVKASEVIGTITILISTMLHIYFFCQACIAVHRLKRKSKKDRDSFHELSDDMEASKK